MLGCNRLAQVARVAPSGRGKASIERSAQPRGLLRKVCYYSLSIVSAGVTVILPIIFLFIVPPTYVLPDGPNPVSTQILDNAVQNIRLVTSELDNPTTCSQSSIERGTCKSICNPTLEDDAAHRWCDYGNQVVKGACVGQDASFLARSFGPRNARHLSRAYARVIVCVHAQCLLSASQVLLATRLPIAAASPSGCPV